MFCLCVSAFGCVWLSLTASKGAGFIPTLIMRERLPMPSSHFSSSFHPSRCIRPLFFLCCLFTSLFFSPFLSLDNLSVHPALSQPSAHFCCMHASPTSVEDDCTAFESLSVLIDLNAGWPFFISAVNGWLSLWTTALTALFHPAKCKCNRGVVISLREAKESKWEEPPLIRGKHRHQIIPFSDERTFCHSMNN